MKRKKSFFFLVFVSPIQFLVKAPADQVGGVRRTGRGKEVGGRGGGRRERGCAEGAEESQRENNIRKKKTTITN